MKLFNLFKKKKATPVAPVKNHFNSETMTYTINNKEYAIRPKYGDKCWNELLSFRVDEI